jgi:hypothetical protein
MTGDGNDGMAQALEQLRTLRRRARLAVAAGGDAGDTLLRAAVALAWGADVSAERAAQATWADDDPGIQALWDWLAADEDVPCPVDLEQLARRAGRQAQLREQRATAAPPKPAYEPGEWKDSVLALHRAGR